MKLCFLIPALVGLICAILGYLLGKLSGSKSEDDKNLRQELDACVAKNKSLESKLAATPIAKKEEYKQKMSFAAPVPSFNADAAKAVYGKKIKQDDLKLVEGIGPKIAELFNNAGITTWAELGMTSVGKLKEILASAGERYAMHDPGTWARQAKLASEGKWEELKKWQDSLDGGREK